MPTEVLAIATEGIIFLGLIVVIGFVLLSMSVKVIQDKHVGIVERFGAYHRVLPPGIHYIIPFNERLKVMKSFKEDYPLGTRAFSTSDNKNVNVEIFITYVLQDPKRFYYGSGQHKTLLNNISDKLRKPILQTYSNELNAALIDTQPTIFDAC